MPDTALPRKADVVVVGAGLAGLACAHHLHRHGIEAHLFEAQPTPGGRVQTDRHPEGYLLDRGFQVLFTAYPECERLLDYQKLRLRLFHAGALVRCDGRFHRVADPLRHPGNLFETLKAPIGSFQDKIRILKIRQRALSFSLKEIFRRPEMTTEQLLREMRFSPRIIERFFRPFLGGITLERPLRTSSRLFDFVMRMLILGETGVPEEGMGALPRQIASSIPGELQHYSQKVAKVGKRIVVLESGVEILCRFVVIAVEKPLSLGLIGSHDRSTVPRLSSKGVTCAYFAAPESLTDGPWLVLNGDGDGPINNLAVMSQVAPSYAPTGRHLISATVLGTDDVQEELLADRIRANARKWYGDSVDDWEFLRLYRIPHAQPTQEPGFRSRRSFRGFPRDGILYAGDYLETASLNGALVSGRRAAQRVMKALRHSLSE